MINSSRIKYFILCTFVITFVFVKKSFSQVEINGVLENLGSEQELVEGSIFKAKITILPLRAVIDSEIRNALSGKKFLDYFLCSSVEKISFSKNNSEVLEIFLTLVVTTRFEKKEFYIWSYKGLNIPFVMKNISTLKNLSKINEFHIHEQSFLNPFIIPKWAYPLIIFLLLLIFYFGKLKYFSMKAAKAKVAEVKKNKSFWRDEVLKASNRLDYENIVVNHKKLKEIFNEHKSIFDELFYEMNKVMYKREWSKEMIVKVDDIIDKLKKAIKGIDN